MTLREAIMAADLDKVFRHINKKDSRNAAQCDRPSMEQTIETYTAVTKELLGKPRIKSYHMPINVAEVKDLIDRKKYIDVCFLNPKYVKPPKGAKPWGGKNPPEGHYNLNLSKYNKWFSIGWIPWSKIIDTPIVNETKYPVEVVVAEILWELTFYGWTEEKVQRQGDKLEEAFKKATKEIKEGKCIELPPKKKGGYKIVIPDIVSKQIIDTTNKYSKKRKKL
jgi:hypothetical protein